MINVKFRPGKSIDKIFEKLWKHVSERKRKELLGANIGITHTLLSILLNIIATLKKLKKKIKKNMKLALE